MITNWSEKYILGISVIDQQHKQFVSIMDKLEKAMVKAETKNVLEEIFISLDQYAIHHFQTEEKYFKKFNFDGAKEHIEEHSSFVKKLNEIKEKYKKDEIVLSFELISFMTDWLENHLHEMDQKYVKCFRDHGLT